MLLHGMDSTETSVVQAATDIILVRKHGHAVGWYMIVVNHTEYYMIRRGHVAFLSARSANKRGMVLFQMMERLARGLHNDDVEPLPTDCPARPSNALRFLR